MSWLGLAPMQLVLTGLATNGAWWCMPHPPGKEAYVLQASGPFPLSTLLENAPEMWRPGPAGQPCTVTRQGGCLGLLAAAWA